MTRAELVASVRGLLDDDSYDANIITEASNWFVNELCNNNRFRFLEESEELNADTGDTTMDFPDDMQTLISFYMTSPSTYDMMKGYISYGDFMRDNADFASRTAAQPRSWTDFGNGVRFPAPLNAACDFQVDYLRRPTAVADDTDEYELPDGYDELISRGTLARIMERNEDYAEAQQERANLDPLVTAFIRNEARGQIKIGPVIMRTGRRRSTRTARDF
jgi:hypothetical protein